MAPEPTQYGHPDQIVGCHCKDELERDATYTPVFGFVQSGDRLGPGEAFLDPLANDLADSIARMPRGAAIDGGRSPGARRLTLGADKGYDTKNFVADLRRTIILMAASRSAVPVAGVSVAPTTSPCRFSIKACPM